MPGPVSHWLKGSCVRGKPVLPVHTTTGQEGATDRASGRLPWHGGQGSRLSRAQAAGRASVRPGWPGSAVALKGGAPPGGSNVGAVAL